MLLIKILAGLSYDDVCPDLVHVLIAERICFSAGVEEARDSATSFSCLMQNIPGTTAVTVGSCTMHI